MTEMIVHNKHIKHEHITLVNAFIRKCNILIHSDLMDVIILFYAKPLIIGLQFHSQIKYVLYCILSDNYSSVISKAYNAFDLDPQYYIIKHLEYITQFQQITLKGNNWRSSLESLGYPQPILFHLKTTRASRESRELYISETDELENYYPYSYELDDDDIHTMELTID